MQIKLPQPFFFRRPPCCLTASWFHRKFFRCKTTRALFTEKGITSYAPQYEGHAAPPEEILKSSPHVWFKDALDGYDFLKEKGYDDIVVAGLSLGGVFAPKLSLNRDVKGIVTMCAPMEGKTEGTIYDGFLEYARNFKNMKEKIKQRLIKKWKTFTQLRH